MDKNDKNLKYTVLMGVYYKDNPEWLKQSIESILNQTVPPDEYLIMEDGELTDELEQVILEYEKKDIIKIVRFKENRGLGPVLADGVKMATNNLIARMDADDISLSDRCEAQLNAFSNDEELCIVGGAVKEFYENDINDVI